MEQIYSKSIKAFIVVLIYPITRKLPRFDQALCFFVVSDILEYNYFWVLLSIIKSDACKKKGESYIHTTTRRRNAFNANKETTNGI